MQGATHGNNRVMMAPQEAEQEAMRARDAESRLRISMVQELQDAIPDRFHDIAADASHPRATPRSLNLQGTDSEGQQAARQGTTRAQRPVERAGALRDNRQYDWAAGRWAGNPRAGQRSLGGDDVMEGAGVAESTGDANPVRHDPRPTPRLRGPVRAESGSGMMAPPWDERGESVPTHHERPPRVILAATGVRRGRTHLTNNGPRYGGWTKSDSGR